MKSLAVMLVLALFSLEDCIEYALHSSPQVSSARIEAERSRATLDCSRLEYLPSLNIYINQYFNWGRSVDVQELQIIRNRLTKQSGASVGTSFTIFDGLRRVNGAARDKELLKSALWNLRAVEMELGEEITRAYLECLLARELKESLEAVHRGTVEKAGLAEALYRGGRMTRSALMEIEAQLASEEAGIVQAACDEQEAKGRLAALMGYELPLEEFEIQTIDINAEALDRPCRLNLSPEKAPAIQALEHELNAEKYAIRVARGQLLPSASLTGAYGTYYSDISSESFRTQARDNVNPSLTLSFALPVFAGGAALGGIASAEYSMKATGEKLKNALLEMENLLASVERESSALGRKVEADWNCLQACIEKEKASSEEFLEGAIGAAEYIEARKDLIQSDKDYRCSLYKYLFQKKLIEHYNRYGE